MDSGKVVSSRGKGSPLDCISSLHTMDSATSKIVQACITSAFFMCITSSAADSLSDVQQCEAFSHLLHQWHLTYCTCQS